MRPIKTKKVYLSLEEKRQRAKEWNEFESDKVDVAGFCSKDIYDEYVTIKCDRCGKEHDVEAEIFFEIFECEDCDIPVMECPECGKSDAVPIQYYEEYVNSKAKTIKKKTK